MRTTARRAVGFTTGPLAAALLLALGCGRSGTTPRPSPLEAARHASADAGFRKVFPTQVMAVAVSRDGGLVAFTRWDRSVEIWGQNPAAVQAPVSRVGGPAPRPLAGHGDDVRCLAFAPDGHLLASGGADGVIRLWQLPPSPASLGGWPNPSAAAAGPPGWTAVEATTLRTLDGHEAGVEAVCFSPDGRLLASGGRDGSVRLWRPSTGRCETTFRPAGMEFVDDSLRVDETRRGAAITALAFSPDGRFLALGALDGTPIKLWDVSRGELLAAGYGPSSVGALAYSTKGHRLAAADWDGSLVYLAAEDVIGRGRTGFGYYGLRSEPPRGTPLLRSLAFLPDGRTLAVPTSDGVTLLDQYRVVDVLPPPDRPGRSFFCVAASADGRHLVAGDASGAVLHWDLAPGQARSTFRSGKGPVVAVAFSPDGRSVLAGSKGGDLYSGEWTARRWDVASGEARTVASGRGPLFDLALSPDGATLAAAHWQGTLWDVASGSRRHELKRAEPGRVSGGGIIALAFSPDGATLAGLTEQVIPGQLLATWGTGSGQVLSKTPPFDHKVSSCGRIAYTSDGATLIAASQRGVLLLDPAAGRPRVVLPGGRALGSLALPGGYSLQIGRIALAADAGLLATAAEDPQSPGRRRSIQLWDVSRLGAGASSPPPAHAGTEVNGAHPVQTIAADADILALSSDGRKLASATGSSITIWDTATGEQLAALRGHRLAVTDLAFSPDAGTLASGSIDGTVKLWDIPSPVRPGPDGRSPSARPRTTD